MRRTGEHLYGDESRFPVVLEKESKALDEFSITTGKQRSLDALGIVQAWYEVPSNQGNSQCTSYPLECEVLRTLHPHCAVHAS